MDRRNKNTPMSMDQFRAQVAAQRAAMPRRAPVQGRRQMQTRLPLPARSELPGTVAGADNALTLARTDDVIGAAQINEAMMILQKYRAGKAMTEKRIKDSEVWWKRQHWRDMAEFGNPNDDKPTSAYLFNVIMSKHADAIEAYPEPNILPREENDKQTAKTLTSILPVILEQNNHDETYSNTEWQKLKQGTGITGVFWDPERHNGLGDISLQKIEALNLYVEPGVSDIQHSRNVFCIDVVDLDVLRERYPEQLDNHAITGKSFTPEKYATDDNIDMTNKAVVIDWYYKRRRNGKTVLHYVKFVDNVVLYATENDPQLRDRGLYDHGMYPFIVDPLFPVEGSIFAYGYIDIGKKPQETIDRLHQALEKNVLASASKRWFVRNGSEINEEEFFDFTKVAVHTTGSLAEDALREIKTEPLAPINAQYLQLKIEELKETTGNRDAANGGTSSGVTAASAIAAMQERAGMTSKASTKSTYRAYARMITMCIELIRQFYDVERTFRITGKSGEEEFVTFGNASLQLQPNGMVGGEQMYRLPVFDVSVSTQKMSVYTKLAQNEMALQMYNLGFFRPDMADQALAVLDVMDFERKELVEEKIRKNATMAQMLAMYQQIAINQALQSGDAATAEALAANVIQSRQAMGLGNVPAATAAAQGRMTQPDNTVGLEKPEHSVVAKSRAQTNASVVPGGG